MINLNAVLLMIGEEHREWQKVTAGVHSNSALNAKFAFTLLRNFGTGILVLYY